MMSRVLFVRSRRKAVGGGGADVGSIRQLQESYFVPGVQEVPAMAGLENSSNTLLIRDSASSTACTGEREKPQVT